jgi:hypothetical protein
MNEHIVVRRLAIDSLMNRGSDDDNLDDVDDDGSDDDSISIYLYLSIYISISMYLSLISTYSLTM